MEDFARALADFVRDNQAWAAPIVLILAFGESLAFVSLVVPAWGALVAIGALIGVSGISFWPVWLAGGIGAALGDWVSYWLGYHYHAQIARMWPLSRYPELMPRGHAFFEKYGAWAIVLGRFTGPLRATVAIVAGAAEMSPTKFQIANWSSAFLWAFVLLYFGGGIGKLFAWLAERVQ
jgi:membrane protein DedA with SNARE-associated domain